MTGRRVVNAVGRGANGSGVRDAGEGAAGCWGADVVEERRRLRSMKRGHASRTPQPAAYTHCWFSRRSSVYYNTSTRRHWRVHSKASFIICKRVTLFGQSSRTTPNVSGRPKWIEFHFRFYNACELSRHVPNAMSVLNDCIVMRCHCCGRCLWADPRHVDIISPHGLGSHSHLLTSSGNTKIKQLNLTSNDF